MDYYLLLVFFHFFLKTCCLLLVMLYLFFLWAHFIWNINCHAIFYEILKTSQHSFGARSAIRSSDVTAVRRNFWKSLHWVGWCQWTLSWNKEWISYIARSDQAAKCETFRWIYKSNLFGACSNPLSFAKPSSKMDP